MHTFKLLSTARHQRLQARGASSALTTRTARGAFGARSWAPAAALALAWATATAQAAPTTPQALLAGYSAEAGQPAQPARGQRFFTSTQGGEWRCASCHGERPTQPGRHASTGKAIAPLAPAFHAERFTDAAKVEKWFKRNCQDVASRACTPAEKADVLAWLLSIQP